MQGTEKPALTEWIDQHSNVWNPYDRRGGKKWLVKDRANYLGGLLGSKTV